MKLIGVTGKGGAGKTTFANYLKTKSNIGVIHVDEVANAFKEQKFSIFMNKNNRGQKARVKPGLKLFLFRNKFLYDLVLKLRAFIMEKEIDRQIQEFKDQGKEYVIIDDIFLSYNKRYKDLSKIFLIRRPYAERVSALIKRDDLSKADFVATDIVHKKKIYRVDMLDSRLQIITNRYKSKEEYEEFLERLYNKEFAPKETLDDWVRVDNGKSRSVSKVILQAKKLNSTRVKEVRQDSIK